MAKTTSKRKPLRGFRVVLVIVGLVVLGLVGAAVTVNLPSFPDPPELKKVSLELPAAKRATSKVLVALLDVRAKNGFPTQRVPVLRGGQEAIKAGRWLADPSSVLAALGRLNKPSLAAFRAATAAPGCLPGETSVGASRYSYLVLVRGTQLTALEAVALAQTSRASKAVARLAPLQAQLLRMRRCSGTLVGAMVLDAGLRVLLPAWGYLLARPATELSTSERKTIWASIQALEVAPTGVLADTFRHEHAYLAAGLRKLPEQKEAKGTRNARVTAARQLSWPWFDLEDTLRIQRVLSKRLVWLASKSSTDSAWKKRYPEQQYFAAIRGSGLLAMFRYNHTGKVLLSVARPGYQKYALRLDQTACLAAAHRARWTAELKRHGRVLPAAATTTTPRDPFASKPFGAVGAGVHCGVPGQGLPGSPVLALPTPSRPASAPAPKGSASKTGKSAQ